MTVGLTDQMGNRQYSMNWRRVLAVVVLLGMAASASLMAKPSVRRPAVTFIHFYQQTEDLTLWERLIYSLLMTKSTEQPS